ncbi:MAG: hypothetical protein QG608_2297 [Actinomycetota bacterium]|nr:hypothetical protein [Actinomycetota bacterium]
MSTPQPAYLPDSLTITTWGHSWYTRSAPGEPFADLDRAMAETAERGFNTVRICAMPFLLCSSGLDTSALTFTGFSGGYADGTPWYHLPHPVTLDGKERLVQLFEAARRHDCYVALSSWEYQQSACLFEDSSWFSALREVRRRHRPAALADAMARVVDLLATRRLADRIAYVELHHEVEGTWLAEAVPARDPVLVGLQSSLEAAIARFKMRHPSLLVGFGFSPVPVDQMRGLPRNADLALFQPEVEGVLGELVDTFALRDPLRAFPQERAQRELLRPGAPALHDWSCRPEDEWRRKASLISHREIYLHDWCDPYRLDHWLVDRYPYHRIAMTRLLRTWTEVAADWAASQEIPLVFGDGWIGAVPRCSTLEQGPVGQETCEEGVNQARRIGAWGTAVCSTAAPHRTGWADIPRLRRLTSLFSGAPVRSLSVGRSVHAALDRTAMTL